MIGRFVIALVLFVAGAPLVVVGGLATTVGWFVGAAGLWLWERAIDLMDLVWGTTA